MKAKLLFAAALLAPGLPALAQNLKPGLWEVTNKMQSSSGEMEQGMAQMQKQMAGMSPQERKQMEGMMAGQGVKLGSGPGGAGTLSAKVCMTRDMVERNELPAQQGDCKTATQPRSGNTMKMSFTCTTPPSRGEGQVTFNSPESYSMKMAMSSVVDGKPEKINMEGGGKWLGADCGSVKPPAAPPVKR